MRENNELKLNTWNLCAFYIKWRINNKLLFAMRESWRVVGCIWDSDPLYLSIWELSCAKNFFEDFIFFWVVGRGSVWLTQNTIISTKLTTTTPTVTFKKGRSSEYNKDNNKGQEDSPKKLSEYNKDNNKGQEDCCGHDQG